MIKTKDVLRNDFHLKEDSITIAIMIVLAFVQGMLVAAFYTPHQLLPGGITGISILLDYIWKIPTVITMIVLNIPVIIIGILKLDFKFAVMSTIGTFIFTAGITLAPAIIKPILQYVKVEDPVLSVMFGGAVLGITAAPVVKRHATFGGMDIISMLINKKFSISMGVFNVLYNIVIMAVLGVTTKQIELAILSLMALFISNSTFDMAMRGLNRTNTVFIISDKWDDIASEIMHEVKRGLTYIPAEGAYTHAPKKIVYCIVKTVELARLKHIVMKYDPNAMFSVIDTKEVEGRGFGILN